MVAYDQAAFGILVKIGGYQLVSHVIVPIEGYSDSKTNIVGRRCLSMGNIDVFRIYILSHLPILILTLWTKQSATSSVVEMHFSKSLRNTSLWNL